ncbi:hypothetical protein HT749_31925 [Burkholderia cepacia]|uniref:hypothetical protein n=1 Tax=Burkholderia cepacia complex TaxID=87882 RepID=UPI00157B0E5B|nr:MULTISPECIES: hypothetical protein [Burkholderia cepacia complex]MBR8218288.1 hypothetical protein [Burkholderia vietnamiensis]NTX48000.1 hypothetical protein [Burkholderia cepacia]
METNLPIHDAKKPQYTREESNGVVTIRYRAGVEPSIFRRLSLSVGFFIGVILIALVGAGLSSGFQILFISAQNSSKAIELLFMVVPNIVFLVYAVPRVWPGQGVFVMTSDGIKSGRLQVAFKDAKDFSYQKKTDWFSVVVVDVGGKTYEIGRWSDELTVQKLLDEIKRQRRMNSGPSSGNSPK